MFNDTVTDEEIEAERRVTEGTVTKVMETERVQKHQKQGDQKRKWGRDREIGGQDRGWLGGCAGGKARD